MKSLGLYTLVLLAGVSSWADDVGLDGIMDAYLLAKADVGKTQLKPEKIEEQPFTVQVAAYLSEKDSVQHVNDLKKSQKDVFYFTSFARGQVWYKVCVGRFKNIKAAEKFRKEFVKKVEEPFAVVIALKPETIDRKTASVDKLNIEKEKTKIPVASQLVKTHTADYLYSLQVGAFRDENKAKSKLEALGSSETAQISKAVVSGKTWYRVLVGKFETKREAEVFRASFKQSTQDSEAFIQRSSK